MFYISPCGFILPSFHTTDGDLFEDGLTLKNGFFRSRHFAQGSDAGSLELFSEDRDPGDEVEGGGIMGGGGEDSAGAQDIAKMRRDRIEKEEFIRKCRVRSLQIILLN